VMAKNDGNKQNQEQKGTKTVAKNSRNKIYSDINPRNPNNLEILTNSTNNKNQNENLSQNSSNKNSTSMQRTQSLNTTLDNNQDTRRTHHRRSKSKPRIIKEEPPESSGNLENSEKSRNSGFRMRSRAKSQTDLRKSKSVYVAPAPVPPVPDYETRKTAFRTTEIQNSSKNRQEMPIYNTSVNLDSYGPVKYSTNPSNTRNNIPSLDRKQDPHDRNQNPNFRNRWRKPSVEQKPLTLQPKSKDIQPTEIQRNLTNSNNYHTQQPCNRRKTTSVDVSSSSRQIYVKPPESEKFEKLEKMSDKTFEDRDSRRRVRRKSERENSKNGKNPVEFERSKTNLSQNANLEPSSEKIPPKRSTSREQPGDRTREKNRERTRDRTRAKSTNSIKSNQKFASKHCEKIYQLSKPTPSTCKTPESTRSVRRRILSTEQVFSSSKLSTLERLDSFSSGELAFRNKKESESSENSQNSQKSQNQQKSQKLPSLQREYSHLAHLAMHRTTSSPGLNKSLNKSDKKTDKKWELEEKIKPVRLAPRIYDHRAEIQKSLQKSVAQNIDDFEEIKIDDFKVDESEVLETSEHEETTSIEVSEIDPSQHSEKNEENRKSSNEDSSSISLDDSGQGSSNSSDEATRRGSDADVKIEDDKKSLVRLSERKSSKLGTSIKRVTSSSSNNSSSSFSEDKSSSIEKSGVMRRESVQKPKSGGTGMMKWKCTHKKSIKLVVAKTVGVDTTNLH